MKHVSAQGGEFTGRHMLAVMVAFFGVVVAVNVTMAMLAGSSWTGLVVKNAYIASQDFNRHARQQRDQAALGWRSELTIKDGRVRYSLFDHAGRPVGFSAVAVFRRPVYESEDVTINLSPGRGAALEATHHLRDGNWVVEILTDAGLGEPYREAQRIVLVDGTVR